MNTSITALFCCIADFCKGLRRLRAETIDLDGSQTHAIRQALGQ